jgi:hypothetical protein
MGEDNPLPVDLPAAELNGRSGLQAVIESIVTVMVNAKIAGADDSSEDSASDRTPVVIDSEAAHRFRG